MMPRYYIDVLGGAAKVATLVALAPSSYGRPGRPRALLLGGTA
jgi:hypothetical protein